MKQTKLYCVKVMNFVSFGGASIKYYTVASTEEQARRNVRIRFNKEHGLIPSSFVTMKVKEVVEEVKENLRR